MNHELASHARRGQQGLIGGASDLPRRMVRTSHMRWRARGALLLVEGGSAPFTPNAPRSLPMSQGCYPCPWISRAVLPMPPGRHPCPRICNPCPRHDLLPMFPVAQVPGTSANLADICVRVGEVTVTSANLADLCVKSSEVTITRTNLTPRQRAEVRHQPLGEGHG
jgi:hypothetical protein